MLVDELDRAQRDRDHYRNLAWRAYHGRDEGRAPRYAVLRSPAPDEGELMRTLRQIVGLDR